MRFKLHLRNGSVVEFDEICEELFNYDSEIILAEATTRNYSFKMNMRKGRLILYEENGSFYMGKQETHGRNKKTILELKEDLITLEEVELRGGENLEKHDSNI